MSDSHNETQPFIKHTLREVFSPERTTELLAAHTMRALEIYHEFSIHPEKLGARPDQVGQMPTDPLLRQAVENIGDIWEISAGFTAMRLGFVAVNEILKKEPIKKLTNGYQISDEAAFWGSLTTTMAVVATHSLGMWEGPYNSHVGNPVPEMMFGQGVAAVVLAVSHYAAKYREPIKDLAFRMGKSVVNSTKAIEYKLQEFSKSLTDELSSGESHTNDIFERLNQNMNALMTRVENWDPAASIPTPEALMQKLQKGIRSKNETNLNVNGDEN